MVGTHYRCFRGATMIVRCLRNHDDDAGYLSCSVFVRFDQSYGSGNSAISCVQKDEAFGAVALTDDGLEEITPNQKCE